MQIILTEYEKQNWRKCAIVMGIIVAFVMGVMCGFHAGESRAKQHAKTERINIEFKHNERVSELESEIAELKYGKIEPIVSYRMR